MIKSNESSLLELLLLYHLIVSTFRSPLRQINNLAGQLSAPGMETSHTPNWTSLVCRLTPYLMKFNVISEEKTDVYMEKSPLVLVAASDLESRRRGCSSREPRPSQSHSDHHPQC